MNFDIALDLILESINYKHAVAVIEYDGKWLLGLAQNTGDDREDTWVHPGGHIEKGENPKEAAVREAREETGTMCKAVGEPFSLPDKDGVAFVHCIATSEPPLKPNHEFKEIGLFSEKDFDNMELYPNVRQLIDIIT